MGDYRNKEKGKESEYKFFSFQLPSSPSCPSVLSPPTPYFALLSSSYLLSQEIFLQMHLLTLHKS